MAHRTFERAQETTIGTGLGALALAGAPYTMFTFAASGIANGDTFWCLIQHATANEVELTLATYNSGNITRAATPLASSNAGAKVDFSAGTKLISNVAPAAYSAIADNNGNMLMPGPLIAKGIRGTVVAPTISAGTLNLNLLLGEDFNVANNANVTTLNIQNMVAGYGAAFTLELTADGTLRTWTWPGAITWLNTPAPTLSQTNGKKDLFSFFTRNGGTNWYGLIIAQNY